MINYKRILSVVLCVFTGLAASAAVEVVNATTVKVSTLADLDTALSSDEISTIIVTRCITLSNGTVLDGLLSTGEKKTIQVEKPFLPEDGKVRISTVGSTVQMVSPADGDYSEYNLFLVPQGSKVQIHNVTLMGGFTGTRTVANSPSVGGIDNYGFLEMNGVDMLRTGTALLNRPGSRALLVSCNIVRNANWYGGGILNFSQADSASDSYINGGVLIMDRCSLTENESLGPEHGGGAAENQGLMCLNNCVVANNASTEIGGGINNCKGGRLFVMNSVFTGNITTSAAYGTLAGGAIGNAGGASHVHIVNSILAYNGYDDGESVSASSLARYSEAEEVHCTMLHSIYDAISGLPAIDTTGTTKEYSDIFAGVHNTGIVAAGSTGTDGETSPFDHPLVSRSETDSDSWSLAPVMLPQKEDHYVYQLAVTTYFDYSGFFNDTMTIAMAYKEGDEVKPLGEAIGIPENLEESRVTESFDGSSRDPVNFIGAGFVKLSSEEQGEDEEIALFYVQLGQFTGGRVSGVTIYKDSYRSNSIVTVHGIPDSAYYLDGWKINGEVIPNTERLYIFSFTVTTNILISPIFIPVQTKIIKVQQRYPWNNLVDIDYSVSEKDAVDYRLVFIATYIDENGVERNLQLKSFVNNSGKDDEGRYEEQRLGLKPNLRKAGEHRVTWDSAKDGVRLKNGSISLRLIACQGDER